MTKVQPSEAFRKHRHDVMNGLQLVKAYIQLGKPDAAVDAVNRVAEWFQSLASLQNQCENTAMHIVWTAAQCSRLRVKSIEPALLQDDLQSIQICKAMLWWDEQVSQLGVKSMSIEFGTDPGLGTYGFVVTIPATEEIRAWWNHTEQSEMWAFWKDTCIVRWELPS